MDRGGNICLWKEHEKGGYFAAVKCPEQLFQDIRELVGLDVVKAPIAE